MRRRSRTPGHETVTVWHPVVEFTAEGRKYRLKSPADLIQGELSIGKHVKIIYDADDTNHFDLEKILEHEPRVAKIFIAVGIVRAVFFTPFLINKEPNG